MSVRRWIRARRERGQVLIIVAVALVGLLALAGLAIDGGNLFMERRGAQNAVDAAALAGTRLIGLAMMTCDTIDYTGLDAKIAQVVNEYAEGNGISDTNGNPGDAVNDNVTAYYVDSSEARLGGGNPVGSVVGGVPLGTSGVEVEVRDQHRTYFLVVVGIRHIPSSAQAMAMAGVVRQLPAGAGLIPIAVPEVVLEAVEDDGNPDWEMHDTGDGEFCYTPDDPPGSDEICITDPETPHNAQRGWLNLNYIFNNGHLDSDDEDNRTFLRNLSVAGCIDPLPGLKGYASRECPYEYPIFAGHTSYNPDPGYCVGGADDWDCLDGDFIQGNPGHIAAPLMTIYEDYAGESVYAPVFDKVYPREYMVGTFDPQAQPPEGFEHSGGEFPPGGGGTSDAWYYHIVGWVSALVFDTHSTSILYGGFEAKLIQTGPLNPTALGETCSLLVHGVTLWR